MTEPNDELIVLPALMAYRDTAANGFVPPAIGIVKEAGMRRRTRHRVMVAGAFAAVLGLSLAALVNAMPMRGNQPPIAESGPPSPWISPTPSPPPSSQAPPSSPPPTATVRAEIPKSAMLQPQDIGSGYRADDSVEQGDWHLKSLSMFCDRHETRPYTGPKPVREGARERSLLAGSTDVSQRVTLSNVESGQHGMSDARAFVRDCGTISVPGAERRLEIVAEGFAGQDSFLVRDNTGSRWAYARQGGMTTQIHVKSGLSDGKVKEITAKAVTRMCAAVAGGC